MTLGFFAPGRYNAGMKATFLMLVATGLVLTGCGKNSNQPSTPPMSPPATNAAPATNATATAQPAAGGYLGALMQADKSAVKTIDVSYLNQAVQLYQTQEGRLPKDLNELVPNYVAKLPNPPYGYRIDYDPARGVVSVVKQ